MQQQSELFILIRKSQYGDKEALMNVITQFHKLIRNLCRKLNYDGAESDLIIALIETINKIPLDNKGFESDGAIVNYIKISMDNKYTVLYKKNNVIKNIEVATEDIECKIEYCSEDNLFFYELLDKLSPLQKRVLRDMYINGFNVSEVAKKMHISRQAVNQAKNRSFKIIRNYLEQEGAEYGK